MYLLYDLRETIMKARFFIATIALAAGALMAKDYSGAELYSKETWMYGKFEARMQMAAGSGTVSSMFLYHNDSYLGGNEPWVEVDIEILGQNPSSFQSNISTIASAPARHIRSGTILNTVSRQSRNIAP